MAVGDKYNLMSKPDYSYCGYENLLMQRLWKWLKRCEK